ncbi:5785_t:CDS:2 [Acaulospora morrowiae]|uniref:Hexosyltransferase n=1 Tax=Acaulospora morrowiae TaxID=94023 RepID=A0A9N8VGA8_9GLOM|nr:5785_t:CDS:2 [Acaulospora morrowiae]
MLKEYKYCVIFFILCNILFLLYYFSDYLQPSDSTVTLSSFIDDTYIKHPPGVDQNLTIFIGIFTVYEKIEIRNCLREVYTHNNVALARYLGVKKSPVTIRFILGLPKDEHNKDKMEEESKMYGDIVILNITENVDDGKTFEYFKWFAKHREDNYFVKLDDDAFIHLIHYYRELQDLPRQRAYYGAVYYGKGPDDDRAFSSMGGAGYTLSRDLIIDIVGSDWVISNVNGYEDRLVGDWICYVAREKNYFVHYVGFTTTWKPMRQIPFHDFDNDLDLDSSVEIILIHQLKGIEKWNSMKNTYLEYEDGAPILRVIRNSTTKGLVTKKDIVPECWKSEQIWNQTLQNTYKNWFYEAWGFKEGKYSYGPA